MNKLFDCYIGVKNDKSNNACLGLNMGRRMEINLQQIKSIIDIIFKHVIEDLEIKKLEFSSTENLYWDVPSEKLFEVSGDQPELEIGSLFDDWEFLSRILHSNEEGVALMLIHLAPILRHLGEKVGQ